MNPDKRIRVEMAMKLVDEASDTEMFSTHEQWSDLPYSDYMENMQPILIKNMNDLFTQLGDMGFDRMQKAQGKGPKLS